MKSGVKINRPILNLPWYLRKWKGNITCTVNITVDINFLAIVMIRCPLWVHLIATNVITSMVIRSRNLLFLCKHMFDRFVNMETVLLAST